MKNTKLSTAFPTLAKIASENNLLLKRLNDWPAIVLIYNKKQNAKKK